MYVLNVCVIIAIVVWCSPQGGREQQERNILLRLNSFLGVFLDE